MPKLSYQHRQLDLGLEVVVTEKDMRRAFDRCRISMKFGEAMKHPAIATCLRNTARAAILKRMRKRGDGDADVT